MPGRCPDTALSCCKRCGVRPVAAGVRPVAAGVEVEVEVDELAGESLCCAVFLGCGAGGVDTEAAPDASSAVAAAGNGG